MAASIWSTPTEKMLDFPAVNFLRFCDNHGLLHVTGKPRWQTVAGGAREYVRRLAADISGQINLNAEVTTAAAHAHRGGTDPARRRARRRTTRWCSPATPTSRCSCSPIPARPRSSSWAPSPTPTTTWCCTWTRASCPGTSVRRASWNYHADECSLATTGIAVTYDLTILQKLDAKQPVMVTVNPPRPVDPDLVLRQFVYAHPGFDDAAIRRAGTAGRDPGRAAHLVRRRLDALRVPRRRPALGHGGRRAFRTCARRGASRPSRHTHRRALSSEPGPAGAGTWNRGPAGAFRPEKAEG